jgi:hypothetical protein
MLYAKNHSKFYKLFCTTIKPLELYFVNFWDLIHQYEIYIIIFVISSVVVVQNGGFCKKKRLSNLIIILWYAINTFSILYMETI